MDASRELLETLVAKLKATSAVVALVGSRIYDRVPSQPAPKPPYISLGPSTVDSENSNCVDMDRFTFQVDCWSWGAGEAYSSLQVRDVANAVRDALRNWEPTLTHNALALLEHRVTRFFTVQGGTIHQAAMTFEAVLEVPRVTGDSPN